MSAIVDPSFFIVGAPKAGTTALAEYLDSHPNLHISLQKEPHFYSEDLFSVGPQFPTNKDEYRELFRCSSPEQIKRTGEATAWYYYSDIAIPNILKEYKKPLFIFMVRNPIDLIPSLHGQLIYNGPDYEFANDFETSWNLQDRRLAGDSLPYRFRKATDRGSQILQYREVGKLGGRLDYLNRMIPRDNLKVIVFDDFVSNTCQVYRDVLDFLGVPYDGKVDFPRVNAHARRRFRRTVSFLRAAVQPVLRSSLGRSFKRRFGKVSLHAYRRVVAVPQQRQTLSSTIRSEMAECFADDIMKLSQGLQRDLSHWMAPMFVREGR